MPRHGYGCVLVTEQARLDEGVRQRPSFDVDESGHIRKDEALTGGTTANEKVQIWPPQTIT